MDEKTNASEVQPEIQTVAEENAAENQSAPANEQQNTTNDKPSKPKKKKRQPLGLGSTMLASALGFIIAIVVINVLVMAIGLAMIFAVSSADTSTMPVGDNIVVKIDLTKAIVEQPLSEMESLFSNGDNVVSLQTHLNAIANAKDDAKVKGLFLYMGDGGSVSWAQSEELRAAIDDFKTSGKPVVAFGNSYSQPAYYLATAATRVVLNPVGMLDFRGIAAESIFLKEMMDKLGVSIDLIRPGNNTFKSAGETYTMTHFSDANREQVRAYISGIWNHVAEGVAKERNLSIDTINYLADNLESVLANEALSAGMVDTLAFEADVMKMFKNEYGGKRVVASTRYEKSIPEAKAPCNIAVIYAEGDVVGGSGNGMRRDVYANDIAKAFDDAAADTSVKAIVFRINSPGGSAVASEIMTDAVVRAKEKKPVVVSMGAVAASAGYEIASNATTIVAQPTTLTGSIGVFGVVPELGKMLRSKLGITVDTVMTNANAAGFSTMRPLSPTARAMLQRNVEEFYVNFCMRVAKGRSLEVEYVDSIARGRVWTGVDACRLGLVDTLGGMNLAMSLAASAANVEKYNTKVFPKQKDLVSQLLDYAGEKKDTELSMQMRQIFPFYEEMCRWATMEPLQARLPFITNID